jgi:hypothetical protein
MPVEPTATERLACYDRAAPPTAVEKKPATTNTPTAQQGDYIDKLAAENTRLDAKINNICRGC